MPADVQRHHGVDALGPGLVQQVAEVGAPVVRDQGDSALWLDLVERRSQHVPQFGEVEAARPSHRGAGVFVDRAGVAAQGPPSLHQ